MQQFTQSLHILCKNHVKLLRSFHCFLKNYTTDKKFYTTAGGTGPAKYQLGSHLIDIVLSQGVPQGKQGVFQPAQCTFKYGCSTVVL